MTMRRSLSAVALAFLLSCSSPAIRAQETSETSVSQTAAPVATPTKPATKTEKETAAAKAKAEEQRVLALSLLVSLSNEARAFSDQKLRARTLNQIADGLWEADPDQSRTLFRKAWDAAEVADQEAARLLKEARERQAKVRRNGVFPWSESALGGSALGGQTRSRPGRGAAGKTQARESPGACRRN